MKTATSTSETRPPLQVQVFSGIRPSIMLGLLWGGSVALLERTSVEPIVGCGWPTLLALVTLNIGLGTGVAWALLSRRILLGFGLLPLVFLILPAHSKPGANITFSNKTSTKAEVRISRADRPGRSSTLSVAAGSQATYRTAPGDYSESIKVDFSLGSSRLTASIGQLREGEVELTNSGFVLVEVRRNEP